MHFNNGGAPDWPLGAGVHRMARGNDGQLLVGGAVRGVPLAQVCVDRRGVWLLLSDDARGVHVNGRPVRRVAMLRAGDTLHVEGAELRVQADAAPFASSKNLPAQDEADVRVVLRGVGGALHGRSFPLGDALVLGRAGDADLRVDLDGIGERHASLRRMGEQVQLRLSNPATTCWVNGVECRAATLRAGDQVAFAQQARFVLEVPQAGAVEPAASTPPLATAEAIAAQAARIGPNNARRWPWLLLAALLLGLALSALLLFGGH